MSAALMTGALSLSVFASSPASAVDATDPNCDSAQVSTTGTSWAYKICKMPDIDQRRAGLPLDGANYCVPTASLNLMFYLDKHGYPNLLSGNYDPTASDSVNYQEVTAKLSRMGGLVETNPTDGTNRTNTVDGVNELIESKGYEDDLEIDFEELDDEDNVSKRMIELTRGGRDLLNASIGWYDSDGDRVGGHHVTVVGVQGDSAGHHQITFHDPANDNFLNTQSTTLDQTYTLGSDNGDGPKVNGYGGTGVTARLEGVMVLTTAP
ncbi:hypothetical protein [Streptomyces sp. NPDC057675]|uniref:hypothetical protein n=1 Tax=Streptomyces sp. NPDC057675 TaxID=3346204 RepID=UPI0036A45E41